MNPTLEKQGISPLAIKKAWEEFVNTGQSTHVPRQLILDSWQQSRDKGIDPNTERAPNALEASELDERLHNDELGIVGTSILERVADSTFQTNHIVVLANSQGQILYSVGHDAVQAELERINFMPGGSWSIDEVGPNGVGTPIAFNKPELIYGTEHYCEAWQPWACYGSPIHNSAGEVIGAIDITGPANHLSMQTMSLAISIAHTVESELNVLQLRKREKLRQLYQQRKNQINNNASCLIDLNGCIIDADSIFMNFFLDEYQLENSSIRSANPFLWQAIETVISNGVATDYTFNLTNTDELKYIIEPLFDSNDCLGVMLIDNHYFDHSDNIYPIQSVDASNIDFKSQGDQMIKTALEKYNGNISKAARMLGINRTTIYRRLKLLKSN